MSAVQKLAKETLVLAKPKLRVFLHYAKTELTPPKPSELPAAFRGLGKMMASMKSSSIKNLTVKQAWLNTLIAVEVGCWFFVGEVIGKRKLVGYNF